MLRRAAQRRSSAAWGGLTDRNLLFHGGSDDSRLEALGQQETKNKKKSRSNQGDPLRKGDWARNFRSPCRPACAEASPGRQTASVKPSATFCQTRCERPNGSSLKLLQANSISCTGGPWAEASSPSPQCRRIFSTCPAVGDQAKEDHFGLTPLNEAEDPPSLRNYGETGLHRSAATWGRARGPLRTPA